MLPCFTLSAQKSIPIITVIEKELDNWLSSQSSKIQNWVNTTNFRGKSGCISFIADEEGNLEKVLVGMSNAQDCSVFGQLAAQLPKGNYRIDVPLSNQELAAAALSWGLGSYQFAKYKSFPTLEAKLLLTENSIDLSYLNAILRGTYLVRDLINTPAEDMMPDNLAQAAIHLAKKFNGTISTLQGEDLLKEGYRAIHTVGRASIHAPQLIDLAWGNTKHPKITLVGKGVCFDSGGLNLKNAAGMAQMKKDMGGAAHVLGIASIVMTLGLPICLRVLIPAVENAVSSNACRPGDVITTRQGMTIEITNTDAEGRVILSEALDEAARENPALILDFATLTGAARIALGTDIAALFTSNQQLAADIMNCAQKENDPVWHLPLYMPYRKLIDSRVANIANSSSSPYGGAITAAIFLKAFVPDNIHWAHFDVMAWNTTSKPGSPEGGEANGLRAVARYLYEQFKP